MIKDNYEFDILVNGKPAREYIHNGKYYLEGKKGTKYSLRVKNNGYGRILVVPTVDGLNVLDGKEASVNGRGYIVNGYDSLTVDGWRVSDEQVAEFYFSDSKDSYAEKKEKGANLGVIGCAVFREKIRQPIVVKRVIERSPYLDPFDILPRRWHSEEWYSIKTNCDALDAGRRCISLSSMNHTGADRVNVSNASSDLGTGWGDVKNSVVTTVEFEREDSPVSIFEVFYNTKDNLEKIGICLNAKPVYVTPSAFPKDNGYCTPPEK